MALIDPKQIAALPAVFGTGGRLPKIKAWIGEAVTTAAGAWSVDLTSAGFTAVPGIQAQALSTSAAIAASATAILTARTALAAAGFVNLPTTGALGSLSDQRAGAGVTVMVLAIGP